MRIRLEKRLTPSRFMQIATPAASVLLTMALGAIIFQLIGFDGPRAIYETFITPVVASYKWQDVATKAAPLIIIALGLSLGLVHGFALADALARGGLSSFYDATVPELRERFELARDVSEVRLARLRDEQSTPTPAAATFAALNAAAAHDPDLFRLAFRRAGFLDRLDALDRPLPAPPGIPPSPVARDELLAAIAAVA